MLAVSGYEDFAAMANNAEAAALKALELDPGLAEAHSAMAGVHSMFDRFDAALVEAEAAVRLNPSLSDAYLSLGIFDAIARTPREALEMCKVAYELDPLSPSAGAMVASLATWVGEEGLALDALARLRELHPKDPRVYLQIADYHMEKRELDEAQKMLDIAIDLSPNDPMIGVSQAIFFAVSGERTKAEDLLKRLLSGGNESFWLNAELWVQTALGNLDEAFRVLMLQAETHSWPYSIRIEPIYAELRKDPRFLEFCRKVGIKA